MKTLQEVKTNFLIEAVKKRYNSEEITDLQAKMNVAIRHGVEFLTETPLDVYMKMCYKVINEKNALRVAKELHKKGHIKTYMIDGFKLTISGCRATMVKFIPFLLNELKGWSKESKESFLNDADLAPYFKGWLK